MIAQAQGLEEMGGSNIRKKIIETLESNGDLKTSEFRRLVLFALVDLSQGAEDAAVCREQIKKANDRIDRLEKYNLLMIAHKHKKGTIVFLIVILLFVASIIQHLDLWVWTGLIIDELIGVPMP